MTTTSSQPIALTYDLATATTDDTQPPGGGSGDFNRVYVLAASDDGD